MKMRTTAFGAALALSTTLFAADAAAQASQPPTGPRASAKIENALSARDAFLAEHLYPIGEQKGTSGTTATWEVAVAQRPPNGPAIIGVKVTVVRNDAHRTELAYLDADELPALAMAVDYLLSPAAITPTPLIPGVKDLKVGHTEFVFHAAGEFALSCEVSDGQRGVMLRVGWPDALIVTLTSQNVQTLKDIVATAIRITGAK